MGIIKQKDKRTGITYVYESKAFWDKEKKQSRAKRTLIGRLDEATGDIIPTDGRCKTRSPNYDGEPKEKKTMKQLKEENATLRKEIEELKQRIRELENK